jgi:hypothetical protein
MFTRTRRAGKYTYTEALVSYRDPNTKRPTHRCIVRWRAPATLSEELARAEEQVETLRTDIAYWQGVIDRTVQPREWFHPKRARSILADVLVRITIALARLEALAQARDGIARSLRVGERFRDRRKAL